MLRSVAFFVLAISFVAPLSGDESRPRIGERIDDLRFKDIRALNRTIDEFGERKAYVFIFTTTTCPLVQRTIPKVIELDAKYRPQGVQFTAVNVGPIDSIRDMAAHALELDAPFPFVKDSDHSCVRKLGVDRTPAVVVLDSERRLIYRGRVDDQLRLGGSRPEPSRNDLDIALAELLDNKSISVSETPVDGCLITPPIEFDPAAASPTFYKDVLPILQRRCIGCHRPGTAAPFGLLTYEEAAANAEMLAEVVIDERMPPWYAHSKHGKFQNDPSLTRDERNTLVAWAKGDRQQGDPKDAPPAAEFPTSPWRMGEPDLVISMWQEHSLPATGYLPYRYAVLPYVFLHDTWIEAAEIRPGNAAVVHHCNMAYVTSEGSGQETFITGYVPGGQPLDLGRFDNGVAYMIPQFSMLALQIHYTTSGKPEKNRIQVGLRFPRRTVEKRMKHFLLDPHKLNIPPEDGAFLVRSSKTLDEDVSLLGLFTHMHLRGKDMTFLAHVPDKPSETLLQIPNYNFEWQLGYEIEPGTKRLPKGTRIEAIAHFDNSAFNPYNPDPKRTVPWGQQTYDEMFNGFVFYVADDENLNLTVDAKTGQVVRPVAASKQAIKK